MKLAVVCLMAIIGFTVAKEDLLNELDKELLFDILQENKLDERNDPNFCAGKANGDYADPADCAKYITCSNGIAIADRNCPDGLYFNPKNSACDYPNNVDCKSKGSGDCSGKPNGDYADPNNCYGFIKCSNGISYSMNCPSGLKFNKSTKKCDYPSNVVCSANDDVEYDTTATAGNDAVPSKDPFCKNKQDGNYVNPYECDGFIMCSNHLTYFFDCPSILQYNPKTDRCDWPRNVNCGPTPSPTATRPTRPPVTPSPSTFCKRRPNGNYVDPQNCEGFIMCSNHLTYFFDCPANLRYNAKTDRCDWPRNVKCGPTPPPKPTTRPTRPPVTPSPSTFCKRRPNGNYVDPQNCEGFIMCSNHLTYFFDCPANLRYNARTDRCDWPRNVKCSTTLLSDVLETYGRNKNPFCILHGDGNYRDITNCEGYFTCYKGYQIFRECPGTLRFNPITRKCDLPRNVKCGGAGGGKRGRKFCQNKKNGDYRDVLNCNGFIKCSNSYTYFFDCPSILRFNVRTDRCDWPRNVRCPY